MVTEVIGIIISTHTYSRSKLKNLIEKKGEEKPFAMLYFSGVANGSWTGCEEIACESLMSFDIKCIIVNDHQGYSHKKLPVIHSHLSWNCLVRNIPLGFSK